VQEFQADHYAVKRMGRANYHDIMSEHVKSLYRNCEFPSKWVVVKNVAPLYLRVFVGLLWF